MNPPPPTNPLHTGHHGRDQPAKQETSSPTATLRTSATEQRIVVNFPGGTVNRYAIQGITADAIDGKTIIVCGKRVETNEVLRAVEKLSGEHVSKVRRANGAEAVEMHSGGRIVPANSPNALRGWSADGVYLDFSTDARSAEWIENAWPVVASTDGEVIRA